MPDSGKPNVTQPLPQIGSYRLIQQLGSGGMSSVFKAIHVESGHEVAVKVLPRSLAKNPTLLQRFLREAKSAEALEHSNIVSIFDRGAEDGRHYLVLEYVPGGDLHDRVREKGPFSPAETIAIMRASAEGLSHAAGRGMIHRDIKPANLLLDADGKVKITDLGLALQMDDEDERVTRDGTTVGTVDYMAPEQARDSRATSVRSDIYSLGGTAYFLLAGSPPFPGGDVPDKLRRHAQTPAPDVRMIRPDVPEPLARLIQKMMAKRPEARFASYDELIAALDAIPLNAVSAQSAPLYALIDDEGDDDEDDFVLTEASIPLADDRPTLVPSRAIDPPRSGTTPTSTPTPAPSPGKQAVAAEVNLAELAALDEDDGPRPALKRRPAPAPAPAPAAPPPGAYDVDDEEVAYGVAGPPRVSTADDVALKTYIIRGLVYGLAIALLGIVLVQLVKLAPSATEDSIASLDEEELAGNSSMDPGPPLIFPGRVVPVAPKPSGHPGLTKTAATDSTTRTPTTTTVGWVEPTEPPPLIAKESTYPNIDQAQFFPDWAAQPVPDRIKGPFQIIRRVSEDKQVVPDLIRSFNVGGGTVEVADNGPFFERDLRITGEARLIRARPGFRPIVALQSPTLDYFRNRRSILEIEGKRVILDGLDLVLKTDDHRGQTTLFLCKGADLTLRNCTITVIGTRPFNLIQVGEPFMTNPGPPSKVRLERTFVRGAGLTAVALAGGDPADVAIDRSVLLCGGASAISVSGRSAGPRRLWCKRSILAARGPILDVGAGSSVGSPTLVFRALGSTLARINGPTPTSLIVKGDDSSGPPRESLDWLGFDNTLVGWHGWLSEGSGRAATVANLAAARTTWPGTDATSHEQHTPWPASSTLEEATPATLQSMAPNLTTLSLVAAPSPYLWSKTFGTFDRQKIAPPPLLPGTVPGSATRASGGTISTPPPRPNVQRKRTKEEQARLLAPKPAPSAGVATPLVSTPEPPPSPIGDLTFDASAAPWNGDLGAFLKEQYRNEMLLVRVQVRGSGVHPITPVRLPDGVDIEVVVQQNASRPLIWTPQPNASEDALFEAKNANLTLSGVRLTRNARAGPKHLVQVKDGRLTLMNCQLIAGMEPERAGPGLVALRSQGTRPLPSGDRNPGQPVCRLSRCVLITGGTAVEADLGHGVIALDDCAIASGADAIMLHPQAVRRDRFEADLWLDHCTLVASRSFVLLGPWNGSAPGPDRPWLVSSYRCAFLDAFDRGAGRLRETVVLRADAEALAQGALLWQPSNDVYDVSHFTAAGDATPVVPPLGTDVERQWVAFWGLSHVATPVTGPGRGSSGPSVRLLNRKLRPNAVKPADLALDPKDSSGRKAPAVGARLKL
ncbi:MAG: protein kinase [Isosphaeraceae bacterium]